jgi:hypothetical protein
MTVPTSFPSSVTHYATAYAAATYVMFAGDDTALHAAYSISTGVVKAAHRDAMLAAFKLDPAMLTAEAFKAECRRLVTEARAAAVIAKAEKVAKGAKAPAEKESTAPAAELIPATFSQVLAALDSMLTAAPDSAKRTAMLIELSTLGRKHMTPVQNAAAAPRPAVTLTAEADMLPVTNDADTARRAAALLATRKANQRKAALLAEAEAEAEAELVSAE